MDFFQNSLFCLVQSWKISNSVHTLTNKLKELLNSFPTKAFERHLISIFPSDKPDSRNVCFRREVIKTPHSLSDNSQRILSKPIRNNWMKKQHTQTIWSITRGMMMPLLLITIRLDWKLLVIWSQLLKLEYLMKIIIQCSCQSIHSLKIRWSV